MREHPMNAEVTARIVQLRSHLSAISKVSFRSRSGTHSQCGWSGEGQGRVDVLHASDGSLVLTESGHFRLDSSPTGQGKGSESTPRPIPFRNVFRWKPESDHVSLSHERRGPDAAVWLFDLVPPVGGGAGHADLASREAHLCVDDLYQARLDFQPNGFDLAWTITGPKKDEHIHYRYRFT